STVGRLAPLGYGLSPVVDLELLGTLLVSKQPSDLARPDTEHCAALTRPLIVARGCDVSGRVVPDNVLAGKVQRRVGRIRLDEPVAVRIVDVRGVLTAFGHLCQAAFGVPTECLCRRRT